MKIRIIAVVFFHSLFLLSVCKGQSFEWAKKLGGSGNDYGYAIAADAEGNSYVTGTFSGHVWSDSILFEGFTGAEIFLAKYSSTGDLIWFQQAGGKGREYSYGIALDQQANIYITGSFEDTSYFGTTSLVSIGMADAFVAKYDSSGALLWAKAASGNQPKVAKSVSTDIQGNVFITGNFTEKITFPGTTLNSNGNFPDIFVASYASDGSFRWAQKAGGADDDRGTSLATDQQGNVFVTGFFYGTANWGTQSRTSVGSSDVFLAKYSNDGSLIWVKREGGSYGDACFSVATDLSGNAFICGYFLATTSFGNTSLTATGYNDIFLAKYNHAGDFQWVKKAGGLNHDSGNGLATDAQGNVYMTGIFDGNATFGSVALTGIDYEIFVAKYNGSGNLIWVTKAGGGNGDYGYGINTDNQGNLYLTGWYYYTCTFGADSLEPGSMADVFVSKMSMLTGDEEIAISENMKLKIFPNPNKGVFTIELPDGDFGSILLQIYTIDGKMVFSNDLPIELTKKIVSIELKKMPSGVYTVNCMHKGITSYSRIILNNPD